MLFAKFQVYLKKKYIYLKTLHYFILKVLSWLFLTILRHMLKAWACTNKMNREMKVEGGLNAVGQCFQWCHFPLHYCLYNRNIEAGGHEPLYALYTARHCLASGYWNHFNKPTGTGRTHSGCSRNSHFPSVCSPQQTQPSCDCIPFAKRYIHTPQTKDENTVIKMSDNWYNLIEIQNMNKDKICFLLKLIYVLHLIIFLNKLLICYLLIVM